MSSPKWQFLLTDLLGNVLGEITKADQRSVTLPLNRIPSASFIIPSDHPMGDYLIDPTWDGLLQAWRGTTLVFHGPIVSVDDQYDSQTMVQKLAATAAGPMWRLGFREIGTSPAGWSRGDATTTFALGSTAQQIVKDASDYTITPPSLSFDPYHGIAPGTDSTTVVGASGVYFFKPAADAVAELSVGTFDFEVAPVPPTVPASSSSPRSNGIWPTIGQFNTADIIGTANPNVIFEFGTPNSNLSSYGRNIDRSSLCNWGVILQPAVSDYSGVLVSRDTGSLFARSVFEATVDDGGTEWDTLRQNLVNQAVALRTQARQILTIQPHPNANYSALNDFIVGDTVHVHIVLNSKVTMDADVRVWGVTFTLDKEGTETQAIQTVSESAP